MSEVKGLESLSDDDLFLELLSCGRDFYRNMVEGSEDSEKVESRIEEVVREFINRDYDYEDLIEDNEVPFDPSEDLFFMKVKDMFSLLKSVNEVAVKPTYKGNNNG